MIKQYLIQVKFGAETRMELTEGDFLHHAANAMKRVVNGCTAGPEPAVRVLHLVDAEQQDLSSHDTGFVRLTKKQSSLP